MSLLLHFCSFSFAHLLESSFIKGDTGLCFFSFFVAFQNLQNVSFLLITLTVILFQTMSDSV